MFKSGRADDYILRSFIYDKSKYKNGLYQTPELTAYAFGEKYNRASIEKDREYGGIIIKIIDNGREAYTWNRVFIGGKRNVINMFLATLIKMGLDFLLWNKSNTFAATVHTHASCKNKKGEWIGNGTFFFSANDMKFLPQNRYMIAPDGALHCAEGTPSRFVNRRKGSNRTQRYYEEHGWWYGEIKGYGLPYDSVCGPYKPE